VGLDQLRAARFVKILLLGKDGQVGWELQRALAPLGDVVALGSSDSDLRKPDAVAAMVRAAAPHWIVNAAGYTAVDRAESESELAQRVNATAVGALARAARDVNAWLVHYSSDYVFDGSGNTPWHESDVTGPLGAYGRSKLAGEELVRASGCRHLILRTSWVYAARGTNFIRTMLRLARERDALRVVADQVGSPTSAELIADVTAHTIRRAATAPQLAGTYHLAAAGEASWNAVARHAIARARQRGAQVRVAADAIQAIPSTAYPQAARRPLNSRLDTAKLRSTFDLTLPPWQAGVDRVVDELTAPKEPT
jgi:dTDP-4-dehydrorhamnose reductase